MKKIRMNPLLFPAFFSLTACSPADDGPTATDTFGRSVNSSAVYYDTITWNFIRQGHADGVSTREERLCLSGGAARYPIHWIEQNHMINFWKK